MYNSAIEIFYLFFQGVLVFQVLIFSIFYFVTKRKELLYYSLFLFFAAIYFFVNAPYTFFGIPEEKVWNSVWYDSINDNIIIIQNLFYLLFLKAFFVNLASSKKVNRIFDISLLFIPLVLLLFLVLRILRLDGQVVYYTVQLIPVIPAAIVAVSIIKNKFPFAGLVVNGLLCNIIGTSLTVLLNIFRNYNIHHLFTDGYPLFFVRVGILGDMVFFLAAILRKYYFQEKQLAVEKLQSQLAVEQLRNKISGELHDDLGSTLSGISMYTYMVDGLLKSGEYEKARQSLGIIQKSANDMTTHLSDLAWSIKPGQDSLESLIQRLEEYAIDMTAIKNMKLDIKRPGQEYGYNLPIESRRNIYLFCKEAINNAVKYSNGTLLELNTKETKGLLEFSVKDNGKGFDVAQVKRGNGLANMQKRADALGATFILKSEQNKGSLLLLRIKITR